MLIYLKLVLVVHDLCSPIVDSHGPLCESVLLFERGIHQEN